MQYKEIKNRVQVIRYVGYDRDKKRAITKMLGSIDKYSLVIPDELNNALSEDEKSELQAYIQTKRQENHDSSLQYNVKSLPAIMHLVSTTGSNVLDTIDDELAGKYWEAIQTLSKALKSAGHPKPKKPRKTNGEPDDKQMQIGEI